MLSTQVILILYNIVHSLDYGVQKEKHFFLSSTTGYIGEGHFGEVHKGNWKVARGEVEVTVETLDPESPSDDRVKFLKEAAIMGQSVHRNVVKLLGIVAVGEPVSKSCMYVCTSQ